MRVDRENIFDVVPSIGLRLVRLGFTGLHPHGNALIPWNVHSEAQPLGKLGTLIVSPLALAGGVERNRNDQIK